MKNERDQANDVIDDPMGRLEEICGERGINVIPTDKMRGVFYVSDLNTVFVYIEAESADIENAIREFIH